jgi:hypothetical protein
MSVARLDESLLPILENATDPVVIRAKDGRILGVFEPANRDGSAIKSPFTDDEIRELQRNKGDCVPLSEFWKKMGVQ